MASLLEAGQVRLSGRRTFDSGPRAGDSAGPPAAAGTGWPRGPARRPRLPSPRPPRPGRPRETAAARRDRSRTASRSRATRCNSSAPLSRLHAHLVGEGERRAQRVDRGVAPLPRAPADQRQHGVLVEQRLVPQHDVPLGLPLERVEPAAARAPHPDRVVQPHGQPRSQRASASGRRPAGSPSGPPARATPRRSESSARRTVSRTPAGACACAAARRAGQRAASRDAAQRRGRRRRRASAVTRSGAAVSR